MKNDKIFIHFDTNKTLIYTLSDEVELLETCNVFFNETYINDELFRKIDKIINGLKS